MALPGFDALLAWKLFVALPPSEKARLIAYAIGKVLNMDKIREWLKGKKSYILGVSAILAAVVSWSTGALDAKEAIGTIMAALMSMSLRAGSANEAQKAATAATNRQFDQLQP